MNPKYRTESDAMAAEPLPFESLRPITENVPPPFPPSGFASRINPHQIAARGIAQTVAIHPGMAFLTVGLDLMLHAGDVVTAGLLIPFSVGAGVALGIITFMAQRKWCHDDDVTALIKALSVFLLTAIPSPLPYVLFVPAGLIGLFRRK